MNEEFKIYENGELVEPSIAERITSTALSHVQAAVGHLASKVSTSFTSAMANAYTELDLHEFDTKNGTRLLPQYKAQQRQERIAAMAMQYDIRPVRDAVDRFSLLS